MLSEHPDIERRLRQEIYEKVGRTGRPTCDQMHEMNYMRAFLNGMYSISFHLTKYLLLTIFMAEVLRLYPPVLVSFYLFHKSHVYVDVCVAVRSMAGIS